MEIVIEAKDDNKELFLGEAADLLFHYMILKNNTFLYDKIATLADSF